MFTGNGLLGGGATWDPQEAGGASGHSTAHVCMCRLSSALAGFRLHRQADQCRGRVAAESWQAGLSGRIFVQCSIGI